MHCGCPLPDEPADNKLSQITRRLGLSDSVLDKAALQLPGHPNAPEATHSSEHDIVRVGQAGHPAYDLGSPQRRRDMRAKLLRARRTRDAQRVCDGKMSEELYRRGQAHIHPSNMPEAFAEVDHSATEHFVAPCIVAFPGASGTTGLGRYIVVSRVKILVYLSKLRYAVGLGVVSP